MTLDFFYTFWNIVYVLLDFFWSFWDTVYNYIDVLDLEILSLVFDIFCARVPLLPYLIVAMNWSKIIPPCKMCLLRIIKILYVFWNAMEFFTEED